MTSKQLGRRTETISEQTRANIRRSVVRLVSTLGYRATTVRMVAAEVGVTASTIYHHYGRKHELIATVASSLISDRYAPFYAEIDRQRTFDDKVAAMLDGICAQAAEHRTATEFLTVIRIESRREPELAGVREETRTLDLIRELVDFGVSTGAVARDAADDVREALSAVVLGICVQAVGGPPEQSLRIGRGLRIITGIGTR